MTIVDYIEQELGIELAAWQRLLIDHAEAAAEQLRAEQEGPTNE